MGATTPWRPRHRALRNGLIFGAIIAIVQLGNVLFTALSGGNIVDSLFLDGMNASNYTANSAVAAVSYIAFFATVGLAFIAGIRAAYRTGKTSTGALAGLLAGVVGSLIQVVIAVIIISSTTPTRVPLGSLNLTQTNVHVFLALAAVFTGIGGVITGAIIGGVSGAIGGRIGSSRPGAAQDNPPLDLPSYARFLDPTSSDKEQGSRDVQ